jgi:hypothetical protein
MSGLDRWMNGYMDGWRVDGWRVDGWMDGWIKSR